MNIILANDGYYSEHGKSYVSEQELIEYFGSDGNTLHNAKLFLKHRDNEFEQGMELLEKLHS